MPYPAKRSNDLARAASALRKALKTASDLLEAPDPQLRLRAVHAVAQAATALAKIAEVKELEARLEALEEALGVGKPKRGGPEFIARLEPAGVAEMLDEVWGVQHEARGALESG